MTTTTTISTANRERVTKAIVRAQGLFWAGEHADFEDDWTDDVIRLQAEAVADAAIKELLPDRVAFIVALTSLAHEAHGQGGHGESVPSPAFQSAFDDVLRMVYGEDAE